jgi:hypothetical protein
MAQFRQNQGSINKKGISSRLSNPFNYWCLGPEFLRLTQDRFTSTVGERGMNLWV